jgi:hypothetical protein
VRPKKVGIVAQPRRGIDEHRPFVRPRIHDVGIDNPTVNLHHGSAKIIAALLVRTEALE